MAVLKHQEKQLPALTLAKEGVLGQVSQSCLNNLKVTAAKAVHERGEEVSRNAGKVERRERISVSREYQESKAAVSGQSPI